MTGTLPAINIAGTLQTIEQSKRNKRAFHGMKIAMRSQHHKNRIASEIGAVDEKTKKFVENKINQFFAEDSSLDKAEAFANLDQEFDNIFHRKSDPSIQWNDAKKLFNTLKKEANIVASSSKFSLFAGRLTSHLSQIPLIRHITPTINKAMRHLFMGKAMGDEQTNLHIHDFAQSLNVSQTVFTPYQEEVLSRLSDPDRFK